MQKIKQLIANIQEYDFLSTYEENPVYVISMKILSEKDLMKFKKQKKADE